MKMRLANSDDRRRIHSYLACLPMTRDGSPIGYTVEVRELMPSRTIEQNARYWALVTAISQQAPRHMRGEYWAPETWHEYLVRRFAGVEPGPFGTSVRKRTSTMRVAEFSAYMTEIEAWATDELPGFDFEQ